MFNINEMLPSLSGSTSWWLPQTSWHLEEVYLTWARKTGPEIVLSLDGEARGLLELEKDTTSKKDDCRQNNPKIAQNL